jgi:hypothetical protein
MNGGAAGWTEELGVPMARCWEEEQKTRNANRGIGVVGKGT